MSKEINYWYIQMSISANVQLDLEFLHKKEIALVYYEKHKPTQKISIFKNIKEGDIVLVKRNGFTLALVEIVRNCSDKSYNYKDIKYYKHEVKVLDMDSSRKGLPECRGILKKSVKDTTLYKYIKKWHKEILNRDIGSETVEEEIKEVENSKEPTNKDVKNRVTPTPAKKYNIRHIDIYIRDVKSIKELTDKFRIKLNGELYVIVGNNGIGKSTLLISIGHLTKQTFLQRELKGDSFDRSKITYIFNNKDKFEWKKLNPKDKKRAWTNQNQNMKMPRVDGVFESGIISGVRFEHLEFKKDVLDSVDKNKIKISTKQDKNIIKFIRDSLGYIINGDTTPNRYSSLFTDEVYIEKSKKSELIYFYKDKSGKIISEYSFSTGEYFVLAILKLIANRRDKSKKSLIVIDELDISLHPLAQNRLMESIDKYRKEFNITFIVATHSLQIIESTNPKHLYLFENINGRIVITNPIYPAYVVKSIYKHSYYDKIILVEDKLAKNFMEQFIDKLQNSSKDKLYYAIIPIGGWDKVLYTFENRDKYYPKTDVLAILDQDVQPHIGTYQKNVLFIPVKDNIEKYTITNLIKNTMFHRYIEKKCLEDTEKFDYLNIKYSEDVNNSKDFKKYFKSLVSKIGRSSNSRFKGNSYLIEEIIIAFIIDEIKNRKDYNEFGKKVKRFLDIS